MPDLPILIIMILPLLISAVWFAVSLILFRAPSCSAKNRGFRRGMLLVSGIAFGVAAVAAAIDWSTSGFSFSSLVFDILKSSLFIIPSAILARFTIARDNVRCIAGVIFAFYISAVFSVVGLPTLSFFTFDPTIEFVPFVTMADDALNCVLNMAMFVPLGIMLALVCKNGDFLLYVALFGFALSFLIEFLQIFTFRTSDVDDLIMNTLGAVAGCLAVKLLSQKLRSRLSRLSSLSHMSCRMRIADAAAICAAVLAGRFLIL